MNIQVISQSHYGAEVVLKEAGRSTTLHLKRDARGIYTDVWAQRIDLAQPDVTPSFLAGWYGVRAAFALKTNHHSADSLTRTAIRYAFEALPESEQVPA